MVGKVLVVQGGGADRFEAQGLAPILPVRKHPLSVLEEADVDGPATEGEEGSRQAHSRRNPQKVAQGPAGHGRTD